MPRKQKPKIAGVPIIITIDTREFNERNITRDQGEYFIIKFDQQDTEKVNNSEFYVLNNIMSKM